jgi:outer membrane murein-binding lipoprotein Lpp
MDNPVIQTDLAQALGQINQKLDKLSIDVTELKVGQVEIKGELKAVDEKLSGQIKAVDERLSGQIKAVDERLSGQIKVVDERLSGEIKTLGTKVEQLDKRIGNSEFTNRGILIGLIVVILDGAAKFFGIIGNP